MGSAIGKAANFDKYKGTLANMGPDLDYLDGSDFAKFWAEDAKRVVGAVKTIGRVQR